MQREGENPVPHYWEHVFWVWGASDMDDFIADDQEHAPGRRASRRSPCPLLITHGVGDRQIHVKYAHRTYEQAVNSPKRELRLFDDPEGGTEHISIDNMP